MAYFSQERKKEMQPKIKALLKEYNMKGSLSVKHSSAVVLNLKEGAVDFGVERDYEQVNTFYIDKLYKGVAKEFLLKAKAILMSGNHNNSDLHTDYHDVGWYVDINIGRYDQPYKKVA